MQHKYDKIKIGFITKKKKHTGTLDKFNSSGWNTFHKIAVRQIDFSVKELFGTEKHFTFANLSNKTDQ